MKTQGSTSPRALMWQNTRPPAMQPPTYSPSFWKSMAKMGLPPVTPRTSRMRRSMYSRCSTLGQRSTVAPSPTGM